jgi:hypothetical protein
LKGSSAEREPGAGSDQRATVGRRSAAANPRAFSAREIKRVTASLIAESYFPVAWVIKEVWRILTFFWMCTVAREFVAPCAAPPGRRTRRKAAQKSRFRPLSAITRIIVAFSTSSIHLPLHTNQ